MESWRNPDGSVHYEDYMSSREWRRYREGYWKRNPHELCQRCGMSNYEHRIKFGTRLHLNHKDYRTLGCEADEDLEPICKACHDQEHSGDSNVESLLEALAEPLPKKQVAPWATKFALPETGWEAGALDLIAKRRRTISEVVHEDQEAVWEVLSRLSWLEDYVRACAEIAKPE